MSNFKLKEYHDEIRKTTGNIRRLKKALRMEEQKRTNLRRELTRYTNQNKPPQNLAMDKYVRKAPWKMKIAFAITHNGGQATIHEILDILLAADKTLTMGGIKNTVKVTLKRMTANLETVRIGVSNSKYKLNTAQA